MTSPEIRELQVFLALVQTGSFGAAAKHLGITQPAISAQIVKLEQHVGFPLFHRGPEGTHITEQGKSLVPFVEDIEGEYGALLRRVSYWNRAVQKHVKIWCDGSKSSHYIRATALPKSSTNIVEEWSDLEAGTNWIDAIVNYETDIVLAGSFLKAGEAAGIKTKVLHRERGITIAWNPDYYQFTEDPFSFPDAISSTVILPAPSMAMGFKEFLIQWCQNAYGQSLADSIESTSEADALDACKLGLGIMIFPGDTEIRMDLKSYGLRASRTFEFLLPNAFEFGIRYRSAEQNSQVLAIVERLKSFF